MRQLSAVAVLSVLILSGCALRAPKLYKPATPAVLADGYDVAAYTADKKAYSDSVAAGKLDDARVYRDRMIWNARWSIDTAFEEYSNGLGHLRATTGLAYDVAAAGISGVAATTGAQRTKDILAVILLGVQNTNSSIDKRYYANMSPETFIAAMQSARKPWSDKLDAAVKLPVSDYSFEQARADLGHLYYAGTLQSAIQYLSAASQPKQ